MEFIFDALLTSMFYFSFLLIVYDSFVMYPLIANDCVDTIPFFYFSMFIYCVSPLPIFEIVNFLDGFAMTGSCFTEPLERLLSPLS